MSILVLIHIIYCTQCDILKPCYLGIVKEKGIDNVTVDDLIDEVTPKARGELISITILSLIFVNELYHARFSCKFMNNSSLHYLHLN